MRLPRTCALTLLLGAWIACAGRELVVPSWATAEEPATIAPPVSEAPGLTDLDAAVDTKLSANSLDDLAQVLDLCRRAVNKGLDEGERKFAEELYTGTLVDRAGMVVEAVFANQNPDPQWPRMRSYALRDLGEAITRDPDLGTAHLMIARLEALPGGNRARALAAAEKALELVGDDRLMAAQAHVIRGNLEDGNSEKRLADYDAAVEMAPRDKDVRRTRGLFHLLNDDAEKAVIDLDVAIEESPDDASLLEARGMAFMMANKLDEAQQAFDKAIALDPAATGALLQRARLLALKGDRPQAIADLEKAIELSPEDAFPLVLRARIHQQAGDTPQAMQDLERVLAKNPDQAAALEMRGLLAADRNDYPAAIADFRRLVRINGDDPVLIGQLGLLYLAAKQPREAIRRFTRALELDDNQFLSRRARSDAEISIGEHTAAIRDLEKALSLEPDNEGVLNNLAWLLATSPDDALRDGPRAIEIASKACEKTEWKQAHIISTLAAGYAEAGDFDQAKKYSRQAVYTGDSPPDVKQQLESELASYEAGKPWRERQLLEDAIVEDAAGPAVAGEKTAAEPAHEQQRQPASQTPRRPFD